MSKRAPYGRRRWLGILQMGMIVFIFGTIYYLFGTGNPPREYVYPLAYSMAFICFSYITLRVTRAGSAPIGEAFILVFALIVFFSVSQNVNNPSLGWLFFETAPAYRALNIWDQTVTQVEINMGHFFIVLAVLAGFGVHSIWGILRDNLFQKEYSKRKGWTVSLKS